MDKHLFQLKFTAKQLARQHKKVHQLNHLIEPQAVKEETLEKAKIKKALQQGNIEGSKIYAANAIRKKHEALNMLRLSSRVDAVASRVQTAVTMRKLTASMTGVVKGMDIAMKSMNLEQALYFAR
jgi:charged multivesicular body protein 1